jgi:hypothetical protein
MRLTRDIGAKTLTLQCRDDLEPQAEGMLAYLKREFTHHDQRLKDGFTIQFGWSFLRLRDRASDLLICEPNYRGDPFQQWSEDVSATLKFSAEQAGFLRSIAFPASDSLGVRFDDKIVMWKDCLSAPRIYLERVKTSSVGDSGWYIGPVPASREKPAYQSIRVYELIDLRPEVMQALALPPGFLVVFDGDGIAGLQGPGGRKQAPWRLDG